MSSTNRVYKPLTSVARAPKLIPIFLDDVPTVVEDEAGVESTVLENYQFFTWDRRPVAQFMEMLQTLSVVEDAMAKINKKSADMTKEEKKQIAAAELEALRLLVPLAQPMILDEAGQPFIVNGDELPGMVMMAAVNKIAETLGK